MTSPTVPTRSPHEVLAPPASTEDARDEAGRSGSTRDIVPRHRVQYAALRAVLGVLGALRFDAASALGARVGSLGYTPLGIRRRVVERQISVAFPDWTPERAARTARACYENLGRTSIEAAVLSRQGRDAILRMFDPPPEWDLLQSALDKGRGVIAIGGHLGNWELGGAYLAARGISMGAVARQMENPLFDSYLTRTRERMGMRVIPDVQAVRRVPRALRSNAVVAFLIDQGAVGLASSWVPFFGRYAKTPRGPAVFALRLNTPVFFMVPLRRPDGRFDLRMEEIRVEQTGNLNADVERIVAGYSAVLERWVRVAPEQYFWHHRRWKHQRPGTPPELGDPL